MKKRFVTTLIAFIACIACALGLVACGDDTDSVAGKSYEFEKVTVESGAEGAAKELTETQLNQLYAGSTLSFDSEGNYTLTMMGVPMTDTYTQSGATVTLNQGNEKQSASVSGDTIVMTFESEGIKASLTYKLVADENEGSDEEEGEEGNNEEEEGESGPISGTLNVAGKTFVFSDMTVSFDNTVSDEMKEQVNATMTEMKAVYNGSTLVFNANGGFTMSIMGESVSGTYTQNGASLVLTVEGSPQDFALNGNKLSAVNVYEGVTQTMIYTLQA